MTSNKTIKSLKPVDCAGEHRWDKTTLIILLSRNNGTGPYSFPIQNSTFIFQTFLDLIAVVVLPLDLIIK